MGEATITADVGAAARSAGGSYQNAVRLSFDEAQRGLKYVLLRITSLMRVGFRNLGRVR